MGSELQSVCEVCRDRNMNKCVCVCVIRDADRIEQLSVSSDSPLSENSDGEAEAHHPEQTSARAAMQHVKR